MRSSISSTASPPGLSSLRTELEDNFRSILRNNLDRFDLVSRERFEAQAALLARTQAKLEALEHPVESGDQGAQLGRRRGLIAEPRGQVSGSDLLRGRGHPSQRRGGARGDQVAAEERRRERDATDDQERPLDLFLGVGDRRDPAAVVRHGPGTRRRMLPRLLAIDDV